MLKKCLLIGGLVIAVAVRSEAQPQPAAPTFYWCEPLKAYFPYVQQCPVAWRPVPYSAAYPTPAPSPPRQTPPANSGPIAIAPTPAPTVAPAPASPPPKPLAPPAAVPQASRGGGPFVVSMQASASNGSQPIISGKTNLPDGTHLAVWLDRPWLVNGRERLAVNLPACGETCAPLAANPGFLSDDVVVKNGEFRDGPISDNGANLKPGIYVLEVTAPFASLQPPEVRAIIGNLGENMMGPLVDACCGSGHENQVQIQKELSDLRASAPVLGASVYYARQISIAP